MGRASGNRDCSVPARASRSRSSARTFPTPVPSAAAMPRRTTLISWIATWPIRPDVAGFRAAPTPPRSSARRCRPRKTRRAGGQPHGRFTPMALGPLGRHWQAGRLCRPLRRRLAGRALPFLPADFDERYFQSAPADQWTDHLRGGEEVLLLNLTGEARGLPRAAQEVPVTFFLKRVATKPRRHGSIPCWWTATPVAWKSPGAFAGR